MIERPRTHSRESSAETADLYLSNLGLTWKEMSGKRVLDVGALNAEFEHAAREHGVEVISIDKEAVDGEYMPPTDSKFVIANATKMPFADECFDYAVAHMSVMNYMEKGYQEDEYLRYVEDVLREECRILKIGGEFRFTDTALDGDDLKQGDDDIVPEEKTDAYDEWRADREHKTLEEIARRVGFRELRLKKYTREQRDSAKEEYLLTHYFIAVK